MEFSLVNLLLVLTIAWLGGALAGRLGYPSILGEIFAGIVFGPPLLGVIHSNAGLAALSEVGVFLMMVYIGMEVDPRALKRVGPTAMLTAVGGYLVPFAGGVLLGYQFDLPRNATLLVATVVGVTSLAIMSRIFIDLKLLNTRLSMVLMAGALLSDTAALLVFAGVSSFARAGTMNGLEFVVVLGKALVFFAVSMFLGIKVIPAVGRRLAAIGFTERTANFTLMLLVALLFAEMAELAGLHAVLGAFFAGMFIHEGIAKRKLSHELASLVHDLSLGFLAPIFFVLIGFEVSLKVFETDWRLLAAIIGVAFFGKIVGGFLFYLLTGQGWREGLVVGAGLNARGGVDIILAGIALELGLIDRTIFSILVVMGIITTLTVPMLLKTGVQWLRRRNELRELEGHRQSIIIVGAGALGRRLAQLLEPRRPVVLIDTNKSHCSEARRMGLQAIVGNALKEDVLKNASAEQARAVLALTPNAEVNVLVAQVARELFLVPEVYVALTSEEHEALDPIIEAYDVRQLFGQTVPIEEWDHRVARGEVREAELQINETISLEALIARIEADEPFLPLMAFRDDQFMIVTEEMNFEPGDRLVVLFSEEPRVAVRDRFDRLVERAVTLDMAGAVTLEAFFEKVAEILSERLDLDKDRLFQFLMSRERQSSTVLTPGLAIPHVLLEGEHRFDLLIARCREGIQFDPSLPPVKAIFVLVGTPDERNFHLRALSAIAQIVQNPEFERVWEDAPDMETIREFLLQADRRRFPDVDLVLDPNPLRETERKGG